MIPPCLSCQTISRPATSFPAWLRVLLFFRGYSFVHGDIGDQPLVERLLREQKTEAIINCAAETHVDRSILDPGSFARTDVVGTGVLLEEARRAGLQRFVQVSTDEVYGSVETGMSTEEDRLAPRSPYSASKAGGDLLVLSYWTTFGFPVMVTRGSNTYGPNQYPEKFIPLFVTNAIEDEPLPLYGDGRQRRDWLAVDYIPMKPFNVPEILSTMDKSIQRRKLNLKVKEVLGNHLNESLLKEPVAESDLPFPKEIKRITDCKWDEVNLPDHQSSLEFAKVLAYTLEEKDPYTSGHSERVCYYSDFISKRLSFPPKERSELQIASYLHDIGKVGISNRFINKKGTLTPTDWPSLSNTRRSPLNF